MKSLFKSLLTLAACLYLGGAHFAVLQVMAWAGMVVVYSAENGVARGMEETFSGKKPCPLCKAIKKVEKSDAPAPGEAPKPATGGMEKWFKDLVPLEQARAMRGRVADTFTVDFPVVVMGNGCGAASPPVPPPRMA